MQIVVRAQCVVPQVHAGRLQRQARRSRWAELSLAGAQGGHEHLKTPLAFWNPDHMATPSG